VIQLAALDITSLTTNGLMFEFREGQPAGLPEYVGEDDNVPTAAGMDPGNWTAKRRPLRLYGCVIGEGADVAAQQSSFRSRMAALVTVMDVDSLITISTTGEFGAASASLTNCRPQRMVTEFEFASLYWVGFLELVSIKSPPTWSVTP
jgi:hypothetical protein